MAHYLGTLWAHILQAYESVLVVRVRSQSRCRAEAQQKSSEYEYMCAAHINLFVLLLAYSTHTWSQKYESDVWKCYSKVQLYYTCLCITPLGMFMR